MAALRLAEADDCLWWCFCGDSCTLSWLKEACGSRQSVGRSDGAVMSMLSMFGRCLARRATARPPPAKPPGSAPSAGRGAARPTAARGTRTCGRAATRSAPPLPCCFAHLAPSVLSGSGARFGPWLFVTLWLFAAFKSIEAKPQSRKASARSLTNRAVRQVHSVGAWPVVLLRALHSRRAADAARGLQSDGQQRQSTRALHRHVRLCHA